MIVCSCKVVSDAQVKSVIADVAPELRVSGVSTFPCPALDCGPAAREIGASLLG
jgi:bacterioferritin-associated ferredoxin